MKFTALSFTLLLSSSLAFGHARMIANPGGLFVPRNTSANKAGPCGSGKTGNATFLIAGSTATITFEEFIEHAGHYRVAFSPAADAGFDQHILLDNIADMPGASMGSPNEYSVQITVPNTPCTDCTMQVIQVMLDNPNIPSFYYSCADIVILPQGSSLPAVNPGPNNVIGPIPTPTTTGTGTGTGSTICK